MQAQVAPTSNSASGKGRPKDEVERIIGAMLQARYLALDFGYTGARCGRRLNMRTMPHSGAPSAFDKNIHQIE
jgi:hypothetical protein